MSGKDRNKNINSEKPRSSRDNSVTGCEQVEDKKKEYSATKIRKEKTSKQTTRKTLKLSQTYNIQILNLNLFQKKNDGEK